MTAPALRIRELLRVRNLSIVAAAREIGVNKTTLGDILLGERGISVRTAALLTHWSGEHFAPAFRQDVIDFDDPNRRKRQPYQRADRVSLASRPHGANTQRPCLCCRKPMWSTGAHHRLCPDCRAGGDQFEGHV